MKKQFKIVLTALIVGVNFIFFQNAAQPPSTQTSVVYTPLVASTLVERAMIEMNLYNPDPQGNALMLATSFGMTLSLAVYYGNYDVATFSAESARLALQKLERYDLTNHETPDVDDRKHIDALRVSISPFLSAMYLPNAPFKLRLAENTELQVTPGNFTFNTLAEDGRVVMSKNYDFTNVHLLTKAVNDAIRERPLLDPTKIEPIPEYFSHLHDDPSDRTDSITSLPNLLINEMSYSDLITMDDMQRYYVIRDPFSPTIADTVPLSTDSSGLPVFSKITYEVRSSFDPAKYIAPTTGTLVSSSDPYDSTVYDFYTGEPYIASAPTPVTPPPTGGGYIPNPDPNYDVWDNQGTTPIIGGGGTTPVKNGETYGTSEGE